MIDAHFWWTMAISPFGLWFAAIVVLLTARGGSYGRKIGSELRYTPPLQYSLFALLMTGGFVWIACVLWQTADRWSMVITGSLMGLIFLFLFQPYTLQVDPERGTYRLTIGWPLLQRHWRGSLSDVARLKTVYAKGNTFLIVAWQGSGPREGNVLAVKLGSYRNRREAEAAAAQVQETWGIRVPVESKR